MKKLMLGDHAVAQGAYEAGVKVAAAYPGTPSTEITEYIANFEEVNAEWAVNEKTSMEAGIGAAIAGRRALVAMKHVGLNVAADPLFTFSYTGVNAGLAVVVADDPGMHSSQNEQDSRFYAQSAHVPMLEPADSQEAKDFTMLAYELSEKYGTPVFVRLTTRIAHARSFVEIGERKEVEYPYKQDISKYVMVPANARKRHLAVEEREKRLSKDVNDFSINKIEHGGKTGIVCSGAVYQYVKEALPDFSVFKLGMVYPIAIEKIKEFASKCEEIIVIEELEPFIENTLKANGIACHGKELTGLQGELSVQRLREAILGQKALPTLAQNLPGRPPVMCAGCTHRGVFYILNKLKLNVVGDIGCYSLGCSPPLNAMHTLVCMGASISNAHGMFMARGNPFSKNNVAVIGDSTFIHSGITGLIDAVYNKSNITVIIMDNRTTGMTGHQNHPGTGVTIKGEPTHALDLGEICRACGVQNLSVVDPYNLAEVENAIKECFKADGVSVIIAKRPCILLDKSMQRKAITISDCKKCGLCLKIGCPALSKRKDNSVEVDSALCTGCMVCAQTCKSGAMKW
jgi:indolepyruvate ferredoxin oxidoreductase alpha subunit